ncbi:MAG: hybrid sensor histidine kinase/response regulator, partial [Bacteroidaceae bacterium]|nr:hybrid sensor histidine kinase/response regulator [Bacteroidaceae bacterium]
MKNYFIGIILLFATFARGAITNEMFKTFHLNNGLGMSKRVFSIAEDKDHVIWMATRDGIRRYNGHQMTPYALEGSDHSSLGGKQIGILCAERGDLWAFDNIGRIYRFNSNVNRFELRLDLSRHIKGEIVMNALYVDAEDNCWIALKTGLWRWNTRDDVPQQVMRDEYVNCIMPWGKSLAVGTHSGLWLMEKDGKKRQTMRGQVLSLYGDADNLYVGTFSEGLWHMEAGTTEATPFQTDATDLHKPIRAIERYAGSILLGVDGGGVYQVEKNRVSQLFSTNDRKQSYLMSNGVYCVKRDYQGNIWVGTYNGGVSVALLNIGAVTTIRHERGNPGSLCSNDVKDVKENTDGCVWYSTDSGLSIHNPRTNTWSHHLIGTSLLRMAPTGEGDVWAGTYGEGLYRIDKQGNVKAHYLMEDGTLTSNCVVALCVDGAGCLWVGDINGVVTCYGEGMHKVLTRRMNTVQSLVALPHDRMAACTVDGLAIIDKQQGDMTFYATQNEEGHSSSYITCALFNQGGTVWLGTEGGGLMLYDLNLRRATRVVTTADGLPSNDIYSICFDTRSRLWIST